MIRFDAIGLDADDTLWENETFFRVTEDEFCELLSGHADPETIATRLYDTESANLARYGYGIKGFMLSMVQTAIELTDGRIEGRQIGRILELGSEMLSHPVTLLPGVEDALDVLADRRLILITKGDLMDQERKIAASGLAERFASVHILADKTPEAYARVLMGQGIEAGAFLMAGNSMKSDVIPVLEIGGTGVFIPHEVTWVHEDVPAPDHSCLHYLTDMTGLPALVAGLESGA